MARSNLSKTKRNAVPKTTRWTPEDLERIEEVRELFSLDTFTDAVRTCVLLASKSARTTERRELSKRKIPKYASGGVLINAAERRKRSKRKKTKL